MLDVYLSRNKNFVKGIMPINQASPTQMVTELTIFKF